MRNIRTRKSYWIVAVMLTILGSVVLFSTTTWSSGIRSTGIVRRQEQAKTYIERKENLRSSIIAVENRTSGLEAAGVEKHLEQNLILLVLRNRYPKPVTGYKFSVGDSIEYTERRNHKLLPGEEVREVLPLQVGLDVKGIKILAVIFDDETTDGDPKFIQEIRDRRKGARTELIRTIRLLQETANSSDASLDGALQTVQSHLAPLSSQESASLSADMVAGINSQRYLILQEVHRIRSMHSSQVSSVETKSSSGQSMTRGGLNSLIEQLSRP